MKKSLFCLLLAIMLSWSSAFSQINFGVAPGLGFNSAHLGYKFGNFVPFIGFQYFHAGFITEETGKRFNGTSLENYSEEFKSSTALYVPNLGFKLFLKPVNKINGYIKVNLSKPILSGKVEEDGVTDAEIEEDIKNVKLFGGEFGFGTEYFFDDNFSVGGEFGLRFMRFKHKTETEDMVYDPVNDDYIESTTRREYKASFSPTYARICLNFYFSKQAAN